MKLDESQVKDIAQLYFVKKQTLKKISEEYNVSVNTIKRVLKLNFCDEYETASKRNYKNLDIDHTFFDSIDTENKAYILGYFLADGNMYIDSSYKMRFCLASQDIEILYKFKQILNLNSAVRVYRRDRINSQAECNLEWSSKSQYTALKKLGLSEDKTRTAVICLNLIEPNCVHHFIRGFFDGDGCITIKQKENKEVSFVGTYSVISGLHEFLCQTLNIYPVKIISRTKKQTVYQISWGSKHDIDKIFEYLYTDATLYLQRKYNKFLK